MRGAIVLEPHPFGGPSFSPASVFDPAPLLGGTDPLSAKDTPDFLAAELDRFLFLELLGQMVIVKPLVFPSG
jgi:hypothetical protein